MLLSDRVESEEHVYIESYSIQQAPSDTSVLNVNVESITQEENNVFKGCNNVQQLPSSEKFAQYVPSDMKEEEKSLPVLTSLPADDTEDVFLPVSPIQVKYVVIFPTNSQSAFTLTQFQHYVIAVLTDLYTFDESFFFIMAYE
jgi:hypothetical protein